MKLQVIDWSPTNSKANECYLNDCEDMLGIFAKIFNPKMAVPLLV